MDLAQLHHCPNPERSLDLPVQVRVWLSPWDISRWLILNRWRHFFGLFRRISSADGKMFLKSNICRHIQNFMGCPPVKKNTYPSPSLGSASESSPVWGFIRESSSWVSSSSSYYNTAQYKLRRISHCFETNQAIWQCCIFPFTTWLYLKFELGSIDIHARAQALPYHHSHMPDTHYTTVQVALHAAQHALE